MKTPVELFDTKDVKKVRELLLEAQRFKCALSEVPIDTKQAVLDHSHTTQRVRGVLHRQANACLGKIENLYVRYLSYWYPYSLQEFLRKAAAYLDDNMGHDPSGWYHPHWMKRVQIDFNKLPEKSKSNILLRLGLERGTNSIQRKILLRKALNTRKFTFGFMQQLLEEEKAKYAE